MQTAGQVGCGSRVSKAVVTDILNQLGSIVITSSDSRDTRPIQRSVLADLPDESSPAKALLVTLHFLFPHELLPALDLLDRGLVTQLSHQWSDPSTTVSSVFYVQSASAVTDPVNRRPPTSRFRNAWNPTKVYYEIRMDAWNCTCAAFAQSQLKLLLLGDGLDCSNGPDEQLVGLIGNRSEQVQHQRPVHGSHAPIQEGNLIRDADGQTGMAHMVGGQATGWDTSVPICKHILAVSLAVAAPGLFGQAVSTKEVSMEALAGWVAGWNDIGER